MAETIRWGILSTGRIAHAFATALTYIDTADLVAVGSRSQATANEFGERYRAPHRHASYAALAHDPDVDVVYVATPHVFHKENCLLCLRAGKPVLCEKPLTINAREAREVIDVARQSGLFLMEAMWTRFLPLVCRLRELLAEGAIGEVQMIIGDLGEKMRFGPEHRINNPALGGGALLDVGIYPLAYASMILGAPTRSVSMARFGETGVDERAAVILEYAGGALGIIYAATNLDTPREVIIIGSEGQIRVSSSMHCPTKMVVSRPGQTDQAIMMPLAGNGYNYEALEVMRCLREGRLESEIMPLDESVSLQTTMDRIRAEWGLKYPTE